MGLPGRPGNPGEKGDPGKPGPLVSALNLILKKDDFIFNETELNCLCGSHMDKKNPCSSVYFNAIMKPKLQCLKITCDFVFSEGH